MRRRPAVLAFQAAVLTTLVGGTTAFVALDKTVTLSVDGQEREVRSFARTVDGVLDREGIEVGPHDVVVPAPGSELEDGQRVSVRYGRLLSLTVDGQERRVWTTADDVAEALDQLGVRGEGAFVSVSRSAAISREGLALQMRTAKQVTLVADGKRRAVTTNQPTVAALLREARVALGEADRVSVALDAAPTQGLVVTVQRVTRRDVARTVAVSHGSQRRETDELYEGQTRLRTEGEDGRRLIAVRETLVDGVVRSRREIRDQVVDAPVTEVVLVGTAERPAPEPEPEPAPRRDQAREEQRDEPRPEPREVPREEPRRESSREEEPEQEEEQDSAPTSSGGLDWAALAECESGGDPDIVSSNGLYHGLYQFSVPTWRSVGGSGLPSDASASEQTMRAQRLYDEQGRSPWPVCGSRL